MGILIEMECNNHRIVGTNVCVKWDFEEEKNVFCFSTIFTFVFCFSCIEFNE